MEDERIITEKCVPNVKKCNTFFDFLLSPTETFAAKKKNGGSKNKSTATELTHCFICCFKIRCTF